MVDWVADYAIHRCFSVNIYHVLKISVSGTDVKVYTIFHSVVKGLYNLLSLAMFLKIHNSPAPGSAPWEVSNDLHVLLGIKAVIFLAKKYSIHSNGIFLAKK